MIVCQEVAPQIRETAKFLNSKGVNVTCVEFAFFQAQDGDRLMSQEIVVGEESRRPVQVISKAAPVVDEGKFLASLDENGRVVFSRLLEWSKEKSMLSLGGQRGFLRVSSLIVYAFPSALHIPPTQFTSRVFIPHSGVQAA